MNGMRQKIQNSVALEPRDGVKPLSTVAKGSNQSRQSQYPKVRLLQSNLWRRCAAEKISKERGNAFEGTGGGPGVDWMTIDDAKDHLREHWPNIRSHLLEGIYQPQPGKRIEIPKPHAGPGSSASPVSSIDWFSKPCCKFSKSGEARRSQNTATASDRDAPPIRRWPGDRRGLRRRGCLPNVLDSKFVGSIEQWDFESFQPVDNNFGIGEIGQTSDSGHSYVRHFKLQARTFLAHSMSRSA
jgi:hypothetical protein